MGFDKGNTGAPLVSVIIPTFDRAPMLRELLTALCDQTWPALEVIVIDDGSRDSTAAMIGAFGDMGAGRVLRFVRQANRGPAVARNAGLALATGEFVMFVDSDDLVTPHGITALAAGLQRSSAAFAVGSIVDRVGGLEKRVLPLLDAKAILPSTWMIHAALYRRSAIGAVGTFREDLMPGEDADFRHRVVAAGGSGLIIDDIVGIHRNHAHPRITQLGDPALLGRATIAQFRAFREWAAPRGLLGPGPRRAAVLPLLLAAIRLGAGGDRQGKAEARSLLGSLADGSPFWLRPAAMLLRLDVPIAYRAANAAIGAALPLIRRIRQGPRFPAKP